MNEKIRRKDIYLADFGNTVGCEEKGKRPVLIVQNDFGNKYSSTTIVIPLTKRVETKQRIPTHIEIEPFGKMPFKATILDIFTGKNFHSCCTKEQTCCK